MISAVITCCLLAAALEIDIAPDQPLPFVYTDDPLVIELRSDENADVMVQVSIQAVHKNEITEASYGPVRLHPNGRHWQALKDLPSERGYYTAHIHASADGAAADKTVHFCRMDRVAPAQALPVYAQVDTDNAKAHLALAAAGIRTLRFDAAWPDIETRLEECLAGNFKAVMFLDCGRVQDPALLAGNIARAFTSGIVRWEVDPKNNIDALASVADALREAGCAAPIAVASASPADFQDLMDKQAGRFARECVLVCESPSHADIMSLQRIAENAGYEGWGIHVFSLNPGAAVPGKVNPLIRMIFQNMMLGVLQTGFSVNQVYDEELRESFVYLCGLLHRFPGARFGGRLGLPEPVIAPVFRKGNAWVAALWTDGAPYDAAIALGDAREVRLTDAMNNPLPLGEPNKESITITVDALPKYLSGVAGAVPGQGAGQCAQQLARAFSGSDVFQKNLPQEMMANISSVAAKPSGESIRDQWLNLVRCFPVLEEQWHTGKLPQSVAVPALARLTQLLRCLGTVEENRGQPFLEPLQDALARCNEYQSLYLTGSVATDKPHERGDWLLSEVRGLMDEAEALAASGAKIEAVAVATLAEWRARSLEFSMLTPGETEVAAPAPAPVAAPESSPAPAAAAADQKPGATTPAPAVDSPKAKSSGQSGLSYKEIEHSVAKGDNPSRIASKYGVSTEDFLKWNNLKTNSMLRIGQKLIVRVPEKSPDDSPRDKPNETTRKKSSSRKKR